MTLCCWLVRDPQGRWDSCPRPAVVWLADRLFCAAHATQLAADPPAGGGSPGASASSGPPCAPPRRSAGGQPAVRSAAEPSP